MIQNAIEDFLFYKVQKFNYFLAQQLVKPASVVVCDPVYLISRDTPPHPPRATQAERSRRSFLILPFSPGKPRRQCPVTGDDFVAGIVYSLQGPDPHLPIGGLSFLHRVLSIHQFIRFVRGNGSNRPT